MLNLTPHTIVIRAADGTDTTIPASGMLARVTSTETQVGTCPLTGVSVMRREFGAVEGLPTDGTPCLVSSLVLSAVPAGTAGVYAPDTGPTAIRENGQIIAVTRLVAA